MFGILRYVLSMMVVEAHLFWLFPGAGFAGGYAVFGFYTLSGYLIARVLATNYPFTVAGCGRFFANRALRLYPGYVVALLFALAVAAVIAATRQYGPRMPETS